MGEEANRYSSASGKASLSFIAHNYLAIRNRVSPGRLTTRARDWRWLSGPGSNPATPLVRFVTLGK